jgi:hypothetical protein
MTVRHAAALALSLNACSFVNAAPAEQRIGEHYERVERCLRHPAAIGCCSRANGSLVSGVMVRAVPYAEGDWNEQAPSAASDLERWLSAFYVQLTRGASFEIDLERQADADSCLRQERPSHDPNPLVGIQIGSEAPSASGIWVQYTAAGRLSASLAGETIDHCRSEQRSTLIVDFRPGVDDKRDVLLGSVGIAERDETGASAPITWLRSSVSLGPIRNYRDGRLAQLWSRARLATTKCARFYSQGDCASASEFEAVKYLDLTQLGVMDWAKTLGSAALMIAPGEAARPGSWDLVFSGEGMTEAGVSHRRSLGYGRSYDSGDAWAPVPSPLVPLLGGVSGGTVSTEAGSAVPLDYREPTIVLTPRSGRNNAPNGRWRAARNADGRSA